MINWMVDDVYEGWVDDIVGMVCGKEVGNVL